MLHTRPSLREYGLVRSAVARAARARRTRAACPAGWKPAAWRAKRFLLGPSLTGVLTRMERDGLIARSRCPQDARRTVVRATPAGLKPGEGPLQPPSRRTTRGWKQRLGKARLAQLYALLDEVIALEQPMNTEEADGLEEDAA